MAPERSDSPTSSSLRRSRPTATPRTRTREGWWGDAPWGGRLGDTEVRHRPEEWDPPADVAGTTEVRPPCAPLSRFLAFPRAGEL